jgi:hypothetical protein
VLVVFTSAIRSKGHHHEFAGRPKGMNKQTRKTELLDNGFMTAPGYPFSARDIFGDLRSRLAAEHRHPMSFERLAKMLGRSKSTTYNWFDIFHHPQVLGFLCLLERLPPAERQSFIEAHCRTYPTLDDPRLAHAPGKAAKLLELLDQKAGLTIITGGTDFSRAFVFTALAHAASRADGRLPAAAGIDLHRSNFFVPVESLIYIDGDLGLDHARRLTHKIWPRVLTSGVPRLFFNRVWSSVPEVREDLLRCAGFKHVVIAEEGALDVGDLTTRVSTPIHVLTLSTAKSVPEGILVNCHRVQRAKRPGN